MQNSFAITQNINVDLIKLQYFEYLEHLHKLQSQQIEKALIKLCSCENMGLKRSKMYAYKSMISYSFIPSDFFLLLCSVHINLFPNINIYFMA